MAKPPWLRACFLSLKTTRNDNKNKNEKFRETDEALQNENIQHSCNLLFSAVIHVLARLYIH